MLLGLFHLCLMRFKMSFLKTSEWQCNFHNGPDSFFFFLGGWGIYFKPCSNCPLHWHPSVHLLFTCRSSSTYKICFLLNELAAVFQDHSFVFKICHPPLFCRYILSLTCLKVWTVDHETTVPQITGLIFFFFVSRHASNCQSYTAIKCNCESRASCYGFEKKEVHQAI